MRRLISQFADIPRPVQIALMAMTGVSVGLILKSFWGDWLLLVIVAIGICVVVVMLLAYRALRKHLKKRKAKPFESELMASSSAVPQGVSDVADRAHLDGMRKRFEDGIAKFRSRGKDLYTVPWYVFIGESGSGKTEAIRHCGIKFPPGLQDELQGTGGTINMDWWFTDHGVILDTAGRIVFGDVESVDTKEWHEFLGLLKKHRRHCPINGLLFAIPIDSLIQDDATEIEQKAGKIAREMDQLQRMLGVRFPVYVLVTKADKLTGFRQFFSEFRDPQAQAQMLGWSNPAQLDDPFDPSSIKNSVDQIRERLDRKRLALLQDPVNTEDQSARRTDQIDELYAFPEAVQRIASRLQRYLELIFTTGIWSSKPLFLRGIYFTSSMQHGQALDLELADALNVPIESLQEAAWTEDKAYFLRDVFQEKIFKEWGLVTGHTNIRRVQRRRRIALLGSGFAAAIIILALSFVSWQSFKTKIKSHVTFWQNVATTVVDGESKIRRIVVPEPDDDGFFYKGGSPISIEERIGDYWTRQWYDKLREEGLPEEGDGKKGSKLFNILVMADERYEDEIFTPWTFWPVALIHDEIGFKRERQDAFRHLFDLAVLRPLLEVRNQFTRTDSWSEDETNALAHLIEIQEQGTISNRFIDDQLRFLLGNPADAADDNEAARIVLARNHAPRLQIMLDRLYRGSEQRERAQLSAKLREENRQAIKNAIARLKEYWKNERTGAEGRLEKYRQLLAAVKAFEDAEKHLLRLVMVTDVPKNNWDDRYLRLSSTTAGEQRKSLKELKVDLDNAIAACQFDSGTDATEQNVITLEQALRDAEQALRGEAKRTFNTLLAAAAGDSGVDIEKVTNTEGIAGDLVRFWNEFTTDSEITLRSGDDFVKHADEFYLGSVRDPTWDQGKYKRLYQLRFAMYEKVHALFAAEEPQSDLRFGATARRFTVAREAIDGAKKTLSDLKKQKPDDTGVALDGETLHDRFDKAATLCDAVVDTAQTHLYGIVTGDFNRWIGSIRSGTPLASNIKNLADGEDGGDGQPEKYVLPEVPLTALTLDTKYYPPLATALFRDWAAMSEADPDFENAALKTYAEAYYENWSEAIFRDLLTLKSETWADLVANLQNYDEVAITSRLIHLGDEITTRLTELGATMETVRVKPTFVDSIQERIRKIQEARKEAEERRSEYKKILRNWKALKSDPSRAREGILRKLETQLFVDEYSNPYNPSGTNAEEFVHRFWQQLGIDALGLLVQAVQEGTTDVLDELLTLRRFPIARDGARQLSHDDVIRAKQLVGKILAGASQEYASTKAESPPGSLAARVAPALKRLSSPLVGKEGERFRKWQRLLNALPDEDKKYEADLYVNPKGPPPSPERKRVTDNWNYMDCVTNPSDSYDAKNIVNIVGGEPKPLRKGHEYPADGGLYPRFYEREDSRTPVDGLELVGKQRNQSLVFSGPWAILHLLYACKGQLNPSVNEDGEQTWQAELIIKPKGDEQQYSIWLEVRFKNAELPPVEDWPNEDTAPGDNTP